MHNLRLIRRRFPGGRVEKIILLLSIIALVAGIRLLMLS